MEERHHALISRLLGHRQQTTVNHIERDGDRPPLLLVPLHAPLPPAGEVRVDVDHGLKECGQCGGMSWWRKELPARRRTAWALRAEWDDAKCCQCEPVPEHAVIVRQF